MKTHFIAMALAFVCLTLSARANTLDAQGILRSDSGSILFLSFYDASGLDPVTNSKVKPNACEAFNADLATIREAAEEAIRRGAKGILEMRDVPNGTTPEGYLSPSFSAINPDGKVDEFYFSNLGLVTADGALGTYAFWSSSVHSSMNSVAYDYGFYRGYFSMREKSSRAAVRCVVRN